MQLPGHRQEAATAIEVEGLGKYFSSSGALYAPATSIFARYRKWQPIGTEGGAVDDDDDDDGGDDFDDTADVDRPVVEAEEREGVWALRDVAFSVAPGRVLGVVGGRGAGRTTLIRVLGRIVTPTRGRAVIRGRIAPAAEFAAEFVRPDLDPVGNARQLARLVRIPRDERGAFVANASELVFGPGRDALPAALDERVAIRRIATAVALDPDADVVLLDEVGYAADAAFHERALERLEQLREAGTTIVLASQDIALVRRFCDEAILLEHGEVAAAGEVDDVVMEFRRRRAAESQHRPANLSLHSFSAAAALTGADVMLDGQTIVVRLEFETAAPGTLVLASVRFRRGGSELVFEQSEPSMLGDARRYAFSLRAPVDALDPGSYLVDVEADVDDEDGRTVIGRKAAARFRLGGGRIFDADDGGFDEALDPVPGVLESAPVAADWLVEEL